MVSLIIISGKHEQAIENYDQFLDGAPGYFDDYSKLLYKGDTQ